MVDILTNLIGGTILQYVCISNHQVYILTLHNMSILKKAGVEGGKYSKVPPSELKQ